MESFIYGYLEPRNAPNPTSFIKNPTNYLVPDVSIFDSSTANVPRKNKENFSPEIALKNQVSFKSPLTADRLNYSQQFFDIKTPANVENHAKSNPPEHFLNKELDLSFCSPKKQPLSVIRNNAITVNKNPKSYSDWIKHVNSIQQEKIMNEEIKEPEPTISDLYEVIKNQNNHLKNLQKQVEILLDRTNENSSQRAIEYQQCPCKCSCSKSNQDRNTQNSKSNPVQVSIGIMTSFEINVNSNDTKSNNHSPKNLDMNKKCSEIEYTATPVINKRDSYSNYNFGGLSHLTNTIAEGYSRCKDYSLSEIPEIPEPPEDSIYSSNSIHVDIQEFAESSDDEENNDAEIENNEEYNDSVEAYNNVVEQVENILKQSPRENKDHQPAENVVRVDLPNNVQDLGISFVNLNLTTDSLVMNKKRNDLSVEVNQLVMKYLRDDQLSFLVTKNQKIQKLPNYGKNQFQKQNIFSSPLNGNEVSFATVKHMQKYRLWNNSNEQVACNIQQMIRTEECRPGNKYSSQSKILDITALKQQPKLL